MKETLIALAGAAVFIAAITALAYFFANPYVYEPAVKVETTR